MKKVSTFQLLTPFINPFSNDEVLAVSCKDDPRATICTGLGISPDEYGSFMCFECMKCHKKETIYFNCTSDVMEDLAKMIGANNESGHNIGKAADEINVAIKRGMHIG